MEKKYQKKLVRNRNRNPTEKKDDDDDDDSDDSQSDNTGKNKRMKFDTNKNVENMNNSLTEECNEIKENNEIEDSISENSVYDDHEKLFEKLYNRIIEKYNLEENEFLTHKIYEKMEDDSISSDEKDNLRFVLKYMNRII